MICSGCGAPLIDGTSKCPFCKELLVPDNNNSKSVAKGDVTYKIESKKQLEFIKNSTIDGMSREKRRERIKRKRRQRLKGYAILGLIGAVLIAFIIGFIALIINLFSDKSVYTTAFYSDNKLSLCYDGEVITLSDNAVNLKTLESGDKISDIILQGDMVKTSEDGKITCFLDNYDAKKKQGTLKVMTEDDGEDIITLSDKVSGSFVISEDGEHILFLKNANPKGNRGELWYSSQGDEAVKIADEVDVGNFILTKDGERAAYIKKYNYTARSGDLYMASLDDLTEERFDKDVYKIYESAKDGETLIYAKNYNSEDESFDIYMKNSDTSVFVMGCASAPQFSEEGEYIFALGDKNEDRYNLYRLNTKKVTADKLISNMSGILKISPEGDMVAYSKCFDNNVADYYIWSEDETEIKVADGVNYTKKNQVAISEDFEKVAYIANYDENKNGGILYTLEYESDSVTEPEKISEDVYSCFVLKNSNIVYNKNYSNKRKTAQLFVYDKSETEINPEINPNFIQINENDILCLFDYKEGCGSLYIIDEDLDERKLTTEVRSFYVKENGAVLAERNYDKTSGKFDLYETDKDREEINLVFKDANGILHY